MKLADSSSTDSSRPSTLKTSSSSWSISTSTRQLNKSRRAIQLSSITHTQQTTTTPTRLITGNKFLRAAAEGYVDMLCEASKRDTNAPAPDDFLQLTPTLLAAQSGQLEALRILVGRGGDPERVSALGSSALHLAAAKNHLNCVSFLVNFGVNMWALDNELHTAKDLAAMGQCKRVLDYLDQMMAKQSAINTKSVQRLKDKAKAAAEKRIKHMRKQQLKAIKQVERDERQLAKMSQQRRLLKSAHSMSDIKLVGRAGLSGDDVSFAPNERSSCNSDSPQTMANFLSQKLRSSEMLGRGRRPRSHLLNLIGGSNSSTKSSQHQQQSQLDLDSSYASSSSVSSTSGYLSSCSARSMLKSAMSAADSPPSSESSSNGLSRRPRYSDLVAVRQEELARRLDLDPNETQSQSVPKTPASSNKSDSLFGSRLRGLRGGVSRRVQLKRLLFATGNQTSQSPEMANGQQRCNEEEPSRGCHQSQKGSGSLSALTRARSEPDFEAAAMRKEPEDDSEGEEEEEEDDADRPAGGPTCCEIPTPPPQPPPLIKKQHLVDQDQTKQHQEEHEDDGLQQEQEQLFTHCLSQLKGQQMHHASEEDAATSGKRLRPRKTAGQRALCSNSDELIQHQLIANEFPLRPSIIKQQLHMRSGVGGGAKQKELHQSEQEQLAGRWRKGTTIMSVDSIGSVGSFLHRNPTVDSAPSSGGAQTSISSPGARSASQSISSAVSVDSSPAASSSPSASSYSDPKLPHCNDDKEGAKEAGCREQVQMQMEHFLATNNLAELGITFAQERIDFEALLLLDEEDLKSLNILLGPRRKLLAALARYRQRSGVDVDQTHAVALTVVDTQF